MHNIVTNRLLLRNFSVLDFSAIHAYSSDSEVTKYTLFGPNTLDETRAFLVNVIKREYKKIPQHEFEYGIEYDQILIGAVSLHFDENSEVAEMGWILNPKYQHQGFAFEAANALKEYAIMNYPIKRLIAHCDSRNIASYKLMEKLGMHLVSIEKGVRIEKKDGTYIRDEMLYELLIHR
jgi:RimJ/RimL family protein N-acetyltransferase